LATPFNEDEIRFIKLKLNESAQECLGKYGVKKTTVDQLTEMSGISKGSFYKFYPSKEILFFYVIENYQSSLIEEITAKLKDNHKITPDKFTEFIYDIFQNVRHSFIMNIFENKEFDYLIRKLPKKLILKHHTFDNRFAENLFKYIKLKKGIDAEVVTASLRAIFMTMVYVSEIGEKEYNEVLKLLIKGLAHQIMEVGNYDE